MLSDNDRIRLRHMLEAAERALRFANGRRRSDLEDEDDALVHVLVRLIGVVGEAGRKVSTETRSQLGAIPWPDIVGMRDRLIHDYYDLNLDILWATVQDDLPTLVSSLRQALSEQETI